MSQSYWLAVDERGDETVHQEEPHYNHLHMKWYSSKKVYITKGMALLLVDHKFESVVKAIAYEISCTGITNSKLRILTTLKIYK